MTDLFTEMLAQSIHAFEGKSTDVPEAIKGLDDQLDELNEALKYYLVQLDEAQMTPQQKQRQVALLYVIADLEAMGDLLDKQWMRLARRKRRKQIAFFEQDWQEIVDYHRDLTAVVQLAFAALAAQDAQAAANFFTQKTILSQKKRVLQMQHMRRIQAGVASSVESSALHLDVLSSMRTLLSHASAIAHVVQENLSVHEQENEELWQDATVVPSHVDG
jgi:phosphate:Na+ symporter